MRIKFGIRDNEASVAQSELVLAPIRQAFPSASVELVTVDTTGRHLNETKELEQALLDGLVDFAIHPLELLPPDESEELPLVMYARRVPKKYGLVLAENEKKLPKAKAIGCFTPLQAVQLKELYPKHEILLLDQTAVLCLRLFHSGAIGALVLERTDIDELDLTARVEHWFTSRELVEPAGSGILAVQTRRGTDCECLKPAADQEATCCALAERAFLQAAKGDSTLTGACAGVDKDQLVLTGITTLPGQAPQKGDIFGTPRQAAMLGEMLANHFD